MLICSNEVAAYPEKRLSLKIGDKPNIAGHIPYFDQPKDLVFAVINYDASRLARLKDVLPICGIVFVLD